VQHVDDVATIKLLGIVYITMGYPQRKHIFDNCPNIVKLLDGLYTNYWPNLDEQCIM